MTIFWVVGDDWGWLHVLVKPILKTEISKNPRFSNIRVFDIHL